MELLRMGNLTPPPHAISLRFSRGRIGNISSLFLKEERSSIVNLDSFNFELAWLTVISDYSIRE